MRYSKKAFAACVLTAVLGLLVWSDSNTAFAQGLPVISPAPNFLQPSLDPYGTGNRIVNPYLVPNPNYVPNPFVVTPVVPAPIVPSPVVPALNVSPNGPWTPGYPVFQPILSPPPFVAGPIIIVRP
jgi:hypothetical protein